MPRSSLIEIRLISVFRARSVARPAEAADRRNYWSGGQMLEHSQETGTVPARGQSPLPCKHLPAGSIARGPKRPTAIAAPVFNPLIAGFPVSHAIARGPMSAPAIGPRTSPTTQSSFSRSRDASIVADPLQGFGNISMHDPTVHETILRRFPRLRVSVRKASRRCFADGTPRFCVRLATCHESAATLRAGFTYYYVPSRSVDIPPQCTGARRLALSECSAG